MSHKYSRWNLFTRSYIFLIKGVYSAINSIQTKLPQKMQQNIKSFIPKTAINSHLLHDIVWSKLPGVKLIWLVQCFKHQVYLSCFDYGSMISFLLRVAFHNLNLADIRVLLLSFRVLCNVHRNFNYFSLRRYAFWVLHSFEWYCENLVGHICIWGMMEDI